METAELVFSGLGFQDPSITHADVLSQPGPEEKGRAALQEALSLAEVHTDVIVCGHGDMANCFPDQITADGLAPTNPKFFRRGPAIIVFRVPREGEWKIDAVEILKEDREEIWQNVKQP